MRGRHVRAASAQREKPLGIRASSLARMAWPNTGAAPSVEMPITSGERLTIAPKAKSLSAGLSTTLTGTRSLRGDRGKLLGRSLRIDVDARPGRREQLRLPGCRRAAADEYRALVRERE